jgi:tRNA nucleotidyltransferase (CCA-adding enzyme)
MTSAPDAVPGLVRRVLAACRAVGGEAFLVGGCVRDALLGVPVKDWDIEVFGLTVDHLSAALAPLGRVDEVGRSFGVLKLRKGPLELDISVPRRDTRVGVGHRGIQATADPTMTPTEACRRRDLTINAILMDPETGRIVDPFGGRADLERRVLRAVDDQTFLEDPLRALRVVQFAARFGFEVDPGLVRLGRAAALDELPNERVEGEWRKFLVRGRHLSRGLTYARQADLLARLFPSLLAPPDLGAALDRMVPVRPTDPIDAYVVALATWLAPGPHEAAVHALDRLGVKRIGGVNVRDRALAARAHHADPLTTDAELRWLSTRAPTRATLAVREAWSGMPSPWARCAALGLDDGPPAPLLQGRDLAGLLQPGPAMGRILAATYADQLDGAITDRNSALARARALIELMT